MKQLAEQYNVLSVVQNMAKAQRDRVQEHLENLSVPLDSTVDVLVAGPVNIEATRTIEHKSLIKHLNGIGVNTDSVWRKNKLDVNSMERFVKLKTNAIDDSDPVLDEFREKTGENGDTESIDTASLMQLARANNVALGPYILTESARFALNRSKVMTIAEIRTALNVENVGLLSQTITALSNTLHSVKKRQADSMAEKTKPKPVI
jgi:CRISPR/Cas system type I-B associated protein Csh2 (Cas7 group RAMP superfamily)